MKFEVLCYCSPSMKTVLKTGLQFHSGLLLNYSHSTPILHSINSSRLSVSCDKRSTSFSLTAGATSFRVVASSAFLRRMSSSQFHIKFFHITFHVQLQSRDLLAISRSHHDLSKRQKSHVGVHGRLYLANFEHKG